MNKNHTQGECPICGTCELDYSPVQSDDNGVYYAWECGLCGATGKECYNIEFTSHEITVREDDL